MQNSSWLTYLSQLFWPTALSNILESNQASPSINKEITSMMAYNGLHSVDITTMFLIAFFAFFFSSYVLF